MNLKTYGLGILICGLVWTRRAAAEETASVLSGKQAIEELSLDDLLASETEVAAKKSLTLRDSPAVLSVVTRDEIAALGARDLIDILEMVPGFVPAQDSEGSISAGFRGLWSNDGRHLVLVDGQEMNEPFYTNVRMNNRFPVDQIERIEIIRGPGSAIYGGYAELAVLNIVTRSAANQTGVATTGTLGTFDGLSDRRTTLSASYANKHESLDDLETSFAIFAGRALGSAGVYRDQYGVQYPYLQDNRMEPLFTNIGLGYHGLKLRYIYDGYQAFVRDIADSSTEQPYRIRDLGTYFEARYDAKLFGDRLTVTPRFNFKRQQPWRVADPSIVPYYLKTADRYLGNLTLSYALPRDLAIIGDLNVLAGVEGYLDKAKLDAPEACDTSYQCPFLAGDKVQYKNVAAFAQALLGTDFGSLTLGARFEHHSEVGDSFVPRAAYTIVVGAAHAKIMASQAFRAPSIENINLPPMDPETGDILAVTKPERTTVYEAEVGYEIANLAFVTANAFDITIKDPISYGYDTSSDSEVYKNYSTTGTRGVELGARVKQARGFANVSYSYYSAVGKNRVPQYGVPWQTPVESDVMQSDPSAYRATALLGMPQHKVAAYGAVQMMGDYWLSGSALYLSKRYGYASSILADDGTLAYSTISTEKPVVQLSAFVTVRDVGVRGMNIQAGVHNVLDSRWRYVEAYDGGHAPSPAPSREFMLRVAFDETTLAGAAPR